MTNDISIILPVYNEARSLERVYPSIMEAVALWGAPAEIIFVNDGSTDNSLEMLKAIKEKNPAVKVIDLEKRCGQSGALQAGFDNAEAEIIVTMDADLENDARDMIPLLKKLNEGYDAVCGRRVGRPFVLKALLSWFGNMLFRSFFRTPVRDMACTFRVYNKWALKDLVIRGSWHLYLPVLLHLRGSDIVEVNVLYVPQKRRRPRHSVADQFLATLADFFALLFFRKKILQNGKRDYKIREIL